MCRNIKTLANFTPPATDEEIRAFLAILGESDAGIFVSTGGFTSDAEREARGQERRNIMLVDARRLFDLWVTLCGEEYVFVPIDGGSRGAQG